MVGAKDDAEDGHEVVVELHPRVGQRRREADRGDADHEHLAQDHHEVSHLDRVSQLQKVTLTASPLLY